MGANVAGTRVQRISSSTKKTHADCFCRTRKESVEANRAEIASSSAAQATSIYGVLRDKERLDAGESTQNIAVLTRHEVEGRARLAERLSQALLIKKTQPGNLGDQQQAEKKA